MSVGEVPPVLCLCGPTASGKTAAALALAEHWPVEVVSLDSALVYRGMDIGTAKPSLEERARVPHHLIDLRAPWEPYSAADFARDARAALADIRSRGRLPLLVGGTMLYLKALTEGLDPLPPADPGVRAALDALAAAGGPGALHRELARVDPATAERLPPGDTQRIQRALEVWRLTGQPLSSLHRREALRPAERPGTAEEVVVVLSLEPRERSWLHARIDARLRRMWAEGFLDEVQRLLQDPRVHPGLPALRAVGYRQAMEALESRPPGAPPLADDPAALQALHERCSAATRQLAKRQLTWLRSLTERHRIDCDAENSRKTVLDLALMHWPSP